jgi:O-antigen ligase
MSNKSSLGISRIFLFAGPLGSLAISPFWSYDAINIPKFVSVAAFGGMAWLLIFRHLYQSKTRIFKTLLMLSGLFLALMVLVIIFSKGNLTQQIFGASGRNTGLITYLSFIGIMCAFAISSSETLMKKIGFSLIGTAFVSDVYGLVQTFGADPFSWTNPYSPVFGFLGNPNFLSSLLGIASIVGMAFALEKGTSLIYRISYLSFVLFSLYIIAQTKSQQGFLVFFIGFAIVMYFKVQEFQKLKKFSFIYLILSGSSMILVLMGILQKGPLRSFLYKNSVSERGDFWRAGWKMTLENPVFGVGIDGYRDWYRRSRDAVAVARSGPGFVSDAAHNVFLDLSSGGGFPILLAYISLVSYAFISGIRYIRRGGANSVGFVSIFAAWVAYTAQSLISIGQIGLAIWGWIFGGLIIGIQLKNENQALNQNKSHEIKSIHSANFTVLGFGLILGLLASGPVYISDARFRAATNSGDAIKVVESVNQWPRDVLRMTFASSLLIDSNLPDYGLKVADAATKFSPETYAPWQLIAGISTATEIEKQNAITQMKKLDPLNESLK